MPLDFHSLWDGRSPVPNYSGFAGLGWLELPVAAGKRLALDTAAVSVLGHARGVRVLQSWNARA